MNEIEIYNQETGQYDQGVALAYHEDGSVTVQVGRNIMIMKNSNVYALPTTPPLVGRRVWVYNEDEAVAGRGFVLGQHVVEDPRGLYQLYITVEFDNGAIDIVRATDLSTKPPSTEVTDDE